MPHNLSEYLHLRACLWLSWGSKKVGINSHESPTRVINSRAARAAAARRSARLAMPHNLSEYLHLRACLWLSWGSQKVGINSHESPTRVINSRAARAAAARRSARLAMPHNLSEYLHLRACLWLSWGSKKVGINSHESPTRVINSRAARAAAARRSARLAMPHNLSEYLHLRACLWLSWGSKKVGINSHESPTRAINSRAARAAAARRSARLAMPHNLSEYLHLRACLWLSWGSKKVGINSHESPTRVINSRAARAAAARRSARLAMPHNLSEYLHLRACLWLSWGSKKGGN